MGYSNSFTTDDFWESYNNIVAVNQNPADKAMPGTLGRTINFDLSSLEAEVYEKISFYEPTLRTDIEEVYSGLSTGKLP